MIWVSVTVQFDSQSNLRLRFESFMVLPLVRVQTNLQFTSQLKFRFRYGLTFGQRPVRFTVQPSNKVLANIRLTFL